jgi:FHA domain-containing protein
MRPFAAVERFFERVFERPSARLFRARLQPIQLQRRVERAMESGRLTAGDRIVVPNRYEVRLAPAELRSFGDLADSLELELADAALRFARAHHYAVSDRPVVRLLPDESIAEGDVRVVVSFADGAIRGRGTGEDIADRGRPAADGDRGRGAGIRDAGRPRDAAADAPPMPVVDATRTMIFEVPTVDTPLAVLRSVAPDGRQQRLTLDAGPISIGRATDNDIVLNDGRVSRYHGLLQGREGALVYRDLGSTNGSRVNGVEVDEVVLGAGDRIELGDTVLVVESTAHG